MRNAAAFAFVVLVAAAGAVAGTVLAGPGQTGTAREVATSTGSTTQASGTTAREAAAPARPADVTARTMRLVVRAADGRRVLATTVGAVDPVRTHGGYRPIRPPRWDQAVWVRYRPLVAPTDTAHGTAYVYGHACHHHVCSFTALSRVDVGGSITVTQGARTVRYTISAATSRFPKAGPGSLADLSSGLADRSVPGRIVLITCAYERGDESLNNFVVVGRRPG